MNFIDKTFNFLAIYYHVIWKTLHVLRVNWVDGEFFLLGERISHEGGQRDIFDSNVSCSSQNSGQFQRSGFLLEDFFQGLCIYRRNNIIFLFGFFGISL